jgi:hypothetical protein
MGWLTRAQVARMNEAERMRYLTRTVLGEAVGEGYLGMVAVAQVINNRSMDGRFPSDPVAVAGQPWQFSTNSPSEGGNQSMVDRYGPDSREYRMAEDAVRAAIIDRTAPDITGQSVQYHTISMGWPSTWPTSIKRHGFIDIGGHRFYPTHPVPPGELLGRIAALEYDPDVAVATELSVRARVEPSMPTAMPLGMRAQRAAAAAQQAAAAATMQRARVAAFQAAVDPFEVAMPSPSSLVAAATTPRRATGTAGMTARTFALQQEQVAGMDRPGLTLISPPRRPRAVTTAPWGVRESVAAAVAANDAAAGRGQLVMTGNPNVAGAVVDWLYPRVAEGQGEANQEGKGPRTHADIFAATSARTQQAQDAALSTALADRARRESRPDVPQSQIERSAPRMDIPQSQIERRPVNIVDESQRRAVEAQRPGAMLAADQAARQARSTQQPGQSQIERTPPRVVVSNGRASISTTTNTDRVIQQSMSSARTATDQALAVSLAASIAARRSATAQANVRQQAIEQTATRPTVPARTPVSQAPAVTSDANVRQQAAEQQATRAAPVSRPAPVATSSGAAIQQQANEQRATRAQPAIRPATAPAAVPGPAAPPKVQDRVAPQVLTLAPPPAAPTAPRITVGTAPDFGKLVNVTLPTDATLRPTTTPPKPVPVVTAPTPTTAVVAAPAGQPTVAAPPAPIRRPADAVPLPTRPVGWAAQFGRDRSSGGARSISSLGRSGGGLRQMRGNAVREVTVQR